MSDEREALQTQIAKLQERRTRLEQTIAGLEGEEGAKPEDIEFFSDQLKESDARISALTGRIEKMDADAAEAAERERVQRQDSDVEMYDRAIADRTFSKLPAPVRARLAEAKKTANEAKLLGYRHVKTERTGDLT